MANKVIDFKDIFLVKGKRGEEETDINYIKDPKSNEYLFISVRPLTFVIDHPERLRSYFAIRNWSPYADAELKTLYGGEPVYYGDRLSFNYFPKSDEYVDDLPVYPTIFEYEDFESQKIIITNNDTVARNIYVERSVYNPSTGHATPIKGYDIYENISPGESIYIEPESITLYSAYFGEKLNALHYKIQNSEAIFWPGSKSQQPPYLMYGYEIETGVENIMKDYISGHDFLFHMMNLYTEGNELPPHVKDIICYAYVYIYKLAPDGTKYIDGYDKKIVPFNHRVPYSSGIGFEPVLDEGYKVATNNYPGDYKGDSGYYKYDPKQDFTWDVANITAELKTYTYITGTLPTGVTSIKAYSDIGKTKEITDNTSISHFSSIYFTATYATGYEEDTLTNITSVTGDVVGADQVSAKLKTYTYATGSKTGITSIICKKGSASGATVANGDTITYGDKLYISASAATGYNAPTVSAMPITVTGNVTGADYVSAGTLKTYTYYTGTLPTGVAGIQAYRNGTAISNGATIYHFDTITFSATASTGYNTPAVTNISSVTGNVTGANQVKSGGLKAYTYTQGTLPAGVTKLVAYCNGNVINSGDTIHHFDSMGFGAEWSNGYSGTLGSVPSVAGNVTGSNYVTSNAYQPTASDIGLSLATDGAFTNAYAYVTNKSPYTATFRMSVHTTSGNAERWNSGYITVAAGASTKISVTDTTCSNRLTHPDWYYFCRIKMAIVGPGTSYTAGDYTKGNFWATVYFSGAWTNGAINALKGETLWQSGNTVGSSMGSSVYSPSPSTDKYITWTNISNQTGAITGDRTVSGSYGESWIYPTITSGDIDVSTYGVVRITNRNNCRVTVCLSTSASFGWEHAHLWSPVPANSTYEWHITDGNALWLMWSSGTSPQYARFENYSSYGYQSGAYQYK